MKALTLRQPWAWLVAHRGKNVENRTWPPPRYLRGQRFAIHGGATRDEDGFRLILERCIDFTDAMTFQGIVAVATLKDYVRVDENAEPCPSRTAIPWFIGPFGWFLVDIITLPKPIPCKGQQGLWDVPPEIEAEIIRQIRDLDILNSVDAGARAKKNEVPA